MIVFSYSSATKKQPSSHITGAMLNDLHDLADFRGFEGVVDVGAFAFGFEEAFDAHVAEVVGDQRLFALQIGAEFVHREPRVFLQQRDDREPGRVGDGLQDVSRFFEFLAFCDHGS